MMSKIYIVLDEDGEIDRMGKDAERPARFKSLAAANRRARALASLAPGKEILICEAIASVAVPTGAPKTVSLKP